jgi:hypothetical protein
VAVNGEGDRRHRGVWLARQRRAGGAGGRGAAKAPKFIRDAYLARASKAQIEACGHKCFSRKEREELK